MPHWIANLFLFAALFFLLVLPLRQGQFVDNFVALLFLGETVNVFDLVVIDLLWWRNTQRIRLSALPQKQLYQNPQKHIEAFFSCRGDVCSGSASRWLFVELILIDSCGCCSYSSYKLRYRSSSCASSSGVFAFIK